MVLLELCERINNNKNITEISSFIFKTKDSNGKTILKVNPTLELQHIDDLAPVDYTIFDYKRIISDNGNVSPMMLG